MCAVGPSASGPSFWGPSSWGLILTPLGLKCIPPAPILMSSVTSCSRSVRIFLGWSQSSSWNLTLRLPPILQLTFRLITSPSLALPSGLLSSDQHVWALPSPLQTVPLTCLSLGLCPPVLSRNLGPSIPCPQSFCAAARLRHACPSSPTPVWTCPFLPGSCRTAVLGGSVVMYWSLSPKLSLPHSRDRAFSSFYL